MVNKMPTQRRLIFISHANPEDNDFVRWLATQLVTEGYEVWSDLTKLLGGEKFWSDIEEAIQEATARFLFVSTIHGNSKPGVLRELKLALDVQQANKLDNFVIPLKIDSFPFDSMQETIRNLNMVKFDQNWASGLSNLFQLLEREEIPKSPEADVKCVSDWYNKSIDNTRKIVVSNEKYLSNWFRIQLPRHLHFSLFQGPASSLQAYCKNFPHPHRTHDGYLITFAPEHEIVLSLGDRWVAGAKVEVETAEFIGEGNDELAIKPFDARNIVSDLVRQVWEMELARRGLSSFELASGLKAWFFRDQQLDRNRAYFTGTGNRKAYRQLVGLKSKRDRDGNKVRDGYWHFAVSASTQITPFPRFALRYHVIFTDDGETPWSSARRMHKARRSVCKNWWNREWRDRLLAFCAQIGEGQPTYAFPTGGAELTMTMRPMRFISPWTYFDPTSSGIDETVEIELVEESLGHDDEDGEDDE